MLAIRIVVVEVEETYTPPMKRPNKLRTAKN
jgi:hypothetical protein